MQVLSNSMGVQITQAWTRVHIFFFFWVYNLSQIIFNVESSLGGARRTWTPTWVWLVQA
jgi:hypothetical protein